MGMGVSTAEWVCLQQSGCVYSRVGVYSESGCIHGEVYSWKQ